MMEPIEQTQENEAEVKATPTETTQNPVTETTAETEPATEETPLATQEEAPATEEDADFTTEESATEIEEEAPSAEEAAPQIPLMKTKEEVLARAQEIVAQGDGGQKQELDLLKQLYYKYSRADLMAAQQAYVEAGGDPETFQPELDPTEEAFKDAMQQIRQRRAEIQAEQEQQRNENLERKQAVIEKIKLLATTPEEAGKSYDAFKQLQAEWREIGPVPAEHVSELWKNYQLYVEQFYDMLKLNIQFREYDFRKNLEAKTLLCEQAERLSEEKDVVKAINHLQTLHQEWKEIGPVAKELREEIWNRFKEASTIVRKRHQDFFEARKAQEEENLQRKTELCEKAEAMNAEQPKTMAEWDAKTKEIIDLQTTWKTIGFAPQKANTQIFERFRAACNTFFDNKGTFFKTIKEELNQNLLKKQELLKKAEALKDSTEWKKTTDCLIELQRQWKTIGAVPRKVSDDLWKRFSTACDHFFETKSQHFAGERQAEEANLEKKQGILEQLRQMAEEGAEATAQKLRDLQAQWSETGHVPIRQKEKMYHQYHEIVDTLYKKLNLSQAERRLSSFKTTLRVAAEAGAGTLTRERDRLARAYEIMKSELQTYENNIGFLTASSKKGNTLVQEIQKKADKLKGELNLLREKIKAVEEQMRQQDKE